MQTRRCESDPRHDHALNLARQLETLLADTYHAAAPPRARVAKALAHSLVDELASLAPPHGA